MLIAVSLSFCPVLVYPVEIFFFLKLMTVLGYRKVERNAVSYNRNRQIIFDCITENPGIRFHALERMTGMKEGTLKYHLLILAMKNRIVSFRSDKSVRYFENNGRFSELEKKLFLHLRNPTSRRILEILATSPEVSRKDIAEMVGVTGPSVTWYTKRLSGDGIITTQRTGSVVRYILSPAYVSIFNRFFGKDGVIAFGNPATGEGAGE
jgi:predicted transcriptional regulator